MSDLRDDPLPRGFAHHSPKTGGLLGSAWRGERASNQRPWVSTDTASKAAAIGHSAIPPKVLRRRRESNPEMEAWDLLRPARLGGVPAHRPSIKPTAPYVSEASCASVLRTHWKPRRFVRHQSLTIPDFLLERDQPVCAGPGSRESVPRLDVPAQVTDQRRLLRGHAERGCVVDDEPRFGVAAAVAKGDGDCGYASTSSSSVSCFRTSSGDSSMAICMAARRSPPTICQSAFAASSSVSWGTSRSTPLTSSSRARLLQKILTVQEPLERSI